MAFAQFATGNIYGRVHAEDGSALAGAKVTLRGLGAPQNFISDAQGGFRFLNLSPGRYDIDAALAGYDRTAPASVTVNVGRSPEVEILLRPAMNASIVVTRREPMIDAWRSGSAAVFSRAELQEIPTARDPWVILGQTPGVLLDRVNVGGSESGEQDVVVSRGASDTQKTFNLDGINITGVVGAGSTPIYYDFDSFEQINITTGGSDPRIQTPGAQINMVTQRGTNDLRGALHYFLANHALESATRPSGAAARFLVDGDSVDRNLDWSGDAGGALWRDHLWLWGSYAKQDIRLFAGQALNYASVTPYAGHAGEVTSSPAPVAPDDTTIVDSSAKLNAQPLASNSAELLYTYVKKVTLGRFASPQHPPETTEDQRVPAKIYKIEDTQMLGQSLYVTLFRSRIDTSYSFLPEGGNVQPYIDENGVWHRSFFSQATKRPQTSSRAEGSYFAQTGPIAHELKFGFGYRRAPVTSTSTYPAANALADFSQSPDPSNPNVHVALVTRDGATDYVIDSLHYYLGDTLTAGNWTVQSGLRLDRQTGRNAAISIPASPLIPDVLPAVSVPADARSLEWKSVSPRIGVTYAPGGSQKTLLRGAYNRYVDQLGGNLVGAGNPYNYAAGLYYSWIDRNGDRSVQRDELGGIYGTYGNVSKDPAAALVPSARLDYGMKVPTTDELMAGIEHEVTNDFSVGVEYVYRRFTNFWWNVHEKTRGSGDYVGPADYDCGSRLSGVLPNGKPFNVPLCQIKDGLDTPYTVITTRPDYHQTYRGLDLYAMRRMSNDWMMRASVSFNDRTQHVGPGGIEDPTELLQPPSAITNNYYGCTNCNGGTAVDRSYGSHANVYLDARWQYSVTVLYQLPWRFSVAGSLNGREGYPIPYYYRVGSRRVLVDGVDGGRLPSVHELDLRLAKELDLRRATVTVALEAFNALDLRTVLQRNPSLYSGVGQSNCAQKDASGNAYAPDVCIYGPLNAVQEVQSPRIFRVSAKLTF